MERLQREDPERLHLYHSTIDDIRAEEQLSLIGAVSIASMPGDSEDRRQSLMKIVSKAFRSDPVRHALWLESVTRI